MRSMQLIGYSAPQVGRSAPCPGSAGCSAGPKPQCGKPRAAPSRCASFIDRVGSTLDDVAELRRAAEIIAANLSELGASAGIDRNAGKIAEEISGLSTAAQGIDTHAKKLATGIDELVAILPTLQRLTEIVDPLDNTVVRLGRFVDRIPGAGRRRALPSDQP